MSVYTDALHQFHSTFGLDYSPIPTLAISDDTKNLRIRLMKEELNELIEAMQNGDDLAHIAKELIDTLYVVFGTAESYGLSDLLETFFAEVHRSNMSKLDKDGNVVRRADGKVLKSSLYSPANLAQFLS